MTDSVPQDRQERRKVLLGIGFCLAAMASFSLLDATAKLMAQQYPVPFVVWCRYLSALFVTSLWLMPKHGWALLRTQRPGLQLFRGTVLGVSSLIFVAGLKVMPLAEAAAITYIAPILTTLAAMVVLGERPPSRTGVALLISFGGVLIITRPGMGHFGWEVVLPLATAVCFAVYQICTRLLAPVDNGFATLFIGSTVGTVVATLAVPWFWAWPDRPLDAWLMLAMGVLGTAGHGLLIKSLSLIPASMFAPFIYVQAVVALTLGWLMFGQWPDGWSLLGIAVIVGNGLWMAQAAGRR